MATSITSAFDWWARTVPERTALVFGDDTVSYRLLATWSSRVAGRLVAAGVGTGDRVAVAGDNSAEWAAAALGVLRAGAVLVPVNPRLVGAEVHRILDDSATVGVLADGCVEIALKDAAELGSRFWTIAMDEVTGLRDGGDDHVRIDREPTEPVAVLFTSGSTGRSKGVICTNRTLLDIVFEASLREEGLGTGVRTLLMLPLCFTPGLVYGLVMTGVLGGTLVVERAFDPSRAVSLLERHRIQAIFGVPLIYESMARAPEFADADLSALASAIVGGAAVAVPLLRVWEGKGVRLRQIYGMTEAGGVATANLPEEAQTHPDSCGVGSVFTELRVVRPDGTDCPPGEPGEIVVRGPGVTPGYWNDPATTAAALRDGWLHSGDVGTRDETGRIRFADRIKDLIISGGINISPVEIESVISQIPGVEEVAVIAARDERFGETPAAIVRVSAELDEAAIVAACESQMAAYKVPRYVVVRDAPLPRLPSGKLAKPAIRAEYADVEQRYARVR
ncbi:AMP-binding protein [Frankia sp. CNm7]|uniref:AMP-binding protein n=1 Tax=Frankia nepalensis TaxID=1836974 RepID=A0A937RRL6_9ACTN|nr:AMP-binding protein [Frankia nepalensis]MBL7497767.1 AMP-binding protein [Frankia nepalensis]MBL7512027.1 AMP-binding protein [Frankia nepalensis]MBL7520365.1 AMP-binding protein [Frankia nepalensis]MBL7632079.1 AMP-binding protein [Frankia nepalensis]